MPYKGLQVPRGLNMELSLDALQGAAGPEGSKHGAILMGSYVSLSCHLVGTSRSSFSSGISLVLQTYPQCGKMSEI